MAQRLEIHHTPKHGSWLDIAEIELSVLTGQCLDRRIEDLDILNADSPPGSTRPTPTSAKSIGSSPPTDARIKLRHLYPTNSCALY